MHSSESGDRGRQHIIVARTDGRGWDSGMRRLARVVVPGVPHHLPSPRLARTLKLRRTGRKAGVTQGGNCPQAVSFAGQSRLARSCRGSSRKVAQTKCPGRSFFARGHIPVRLFISRTCGGKGRGNLRASPLFGARAFWIVYNMGGKGCGRSVWRPRPFFCAASAGPDGSDGSAGSDGWAGSDGSAGPDGSAGSDGSDAGRPVGPWVDTRSRKRLRGSGANGDKSIFDDWS